MQVKNCSGAVNSHNTRVKESFHLQEIRRKFVSKQEDHFQHMCHESGWRLHWKFQMATTSRIGDT
jgi:hypothetical protein